MFKFLTLSCLLAVSVQSKISQNQAMPYYFHAQQYPLTYVQNDGTQHFGVPPGQGEYFLSNLWNYAPNFPYIVSGAQPSSEAENAATSEETASEKQPSQSLSKQFTANPLPYFSQPQFYEQAFYDPVKLNAAKNGAVSNFLFPRSQLQSVFQQPQPSSQSNQGSAA